MSHGNNISALITGGSRGIGFSIAKNICPRCSHLFLMSQYEDTLQKAVLELAEYNPECRITPLSGDLAQRRIIPAKAAEAVRSSSGKLDLLVLNAGFCIDANLESISDNDFERIMEVNFHSAHYIISELLKYLKRGNWAKIIIIGSTAAYEPSSLIPAYGIAKWGLRGYTLNLRKELLKYNIGVTLISPGATLTDMWEGEDILEGSLLEPDDIGKLHTLQRKSVKAHVPHYIDVDAVAGIHHQYQICIVFGISAVKQIVVILNITGGVFVQHHGI